MCVACFTTAQLATVGAVSARWWFVNKWRGADDDEELDPEVAPAADEERLPVA
ncbi:MAG: hypothetical protein M3159_07630 [Actinomycetota bacterium]|nr:hypothetical protein [Actinomycetota bacterium]